MLNLVEYLWKKVKVIDIDGKEWIGKVIDYEYPDENEEEKEAISVDIGEEGWNLGLYIDEIKSIEEIN